MVPETIPAAIKAVDYLLSQGYVLISLDEAVALGYIDITKNVIYGIDVNTIRLNRVG
jgi:hypothetical protein